MKCFIYLCDTGRWNASAITSNSMIENVPAKKKK